MRDFNFLSTPPWVSNDYFYTNVVINNGVISIGASAFENSAITSVLISKTVITIGKSAFSNCKYLASVIIPNSVTFYVVNQIFEYYLTKFNISNFMKCLTVKLLGNML